MKPLAALLPALLLAALPLSPEKPLSEAPVAPPSAAFRTDLDAALDAAHREILRRPGVGSARVSLYSDDEHEPFRVQVDVRGSGDMDLPGIARDVRGRLDPIARVRVVVTDGDRRTVGP